MGKLINLFRYFPEARQDIEEVFVYIINTDAPMIFYHSVAKFKIAFGYRYTRIR
jgi:hypothetical protein